MKLSAQRLLAKLPTMTGDQLARLARIFLWARRTTHRGDLITLGDAINLLPRNKGKKIHRSTIQRWIDSGKLPTKKIGGVRYVSRDFLMAMLTVPKANQPEEKSVEPVIVTANKKAASLKRQAALARRQIERMRN